MVTETKKKRRKRETPNNRLAKCQVCGGGIFHLESETAETGQPRGWWHENYELDLQHEAKPIEEA